MKRFRFPLEAVRRWRLEQKNLEELRLQQVVGEQSHLAAQERSAREGLAGSKNELLHQQTLDANDLHSLSVFAEAAGRRLEKLVVAQKACNERIGAQRLKVVEARRNFELFNRLRNQKFKEWSSAAEKEQEDTAAELYVIRTAARVRRPTKAADPGCETQEIQS